jgi:hypothetical protein
MKSSNRPLAILQMRTVRRIGKFILRVRTILLNIGNNATIFVTPTPSPAIVKTDTDNLEAAEAIAETRVAGAAQARNLKYDIVLEDVRGLLSYVQGLADKAADEATAIAIISASGFDLKNHGVRVKPQLAVKNGLAGTVLLASKAAARRVFYEWQQSSDGITWADLPATLQAKTKVSGLTAGSLLFFRVRAILKDGAQDWSSAVSIIVL